MIWFWSVILATLFIFGFPVFRGAPYLPSQKRLIQLAFSELYQLSKHDVLVDIGSGDGVVIRKASKIGARAIGFEINPILVCISSFISRNDKKIKVRLADFWLSHLPDNTTVIYAFSVRRDMEKMYNWLQNETNRINRPVSFISLGFEFEKMKPIKNLGPYYLYVFHPLHQVKPQV